MSILYLVGDSTVCNYDLSCEDRDFLYPRNGYGMWLSSFFKSDIFVKNLALGGRSSKSFLTEDNYKYLTENLREGDFLMIGFGHNDEKFKDEYRFTYGAGDIDNTRSFKYHLYNYYVKLAFDRGATPILTTPIVRRSPTNEYVYDRVHALGEVTCGGQTFSASDYPLAIRELAKDFNVTLIDMTALTKELYFNIGVKKSIELHATTSRSSDDVDNTHLNSFGAKVLARVWCDALKKTDCVLKDHLLNNFISPNLSDRFANK